MTRLARRAFKPVYILYYRFLFGRRVPFGGALARGVRAFEAATGRGDAPAPRDVWEAQYGRGDWDFMQRLDERARYSVVASYLRDVAPAGAVLDVGCGEGLLLDELAPRGYGRYLGIDLSAAAIARAVPRGDGRTAFLAADAEAWEPPAGQRWDAIVMNECIYYFADPLGTVARYERWLAPGGLLVVSMFASRRADAIRRRLDDLRTPVEETRLSNRKGTWTVSVFAGPPETTAER